MTRLTEFVAGRTLAQIYDEEWVPSVLEPFARDLAAFVSPGQSVLDVGCGTGVVAAHAATRAGRAGRVVGLDPTTFLLDRARELRTNPPIEWIDGSADSLPFEAATFHTVLCHQALQYIESPAAAMNQMARVTKDGGMVAISIWSPTPVQVPVRDFEELIARHIDPDCASIHAFGFGGIEALTSLTVQAGLDVVSAKRVSHATTYRSVAACAELMLAGAGRPLPDGSMGLGLFDLEDPKYTPHVEALIHDLERRWAKYIRAGRLQVPYFTDIVVGRCV